MALGFGGNDRGWLVWIAIPSVILALFLPAVRKARDAAGRTTCSNNLRSIGLAAHNSCDARGRFPAGTVPNAALAPEERLSFHIALVPYIESTDRSGRFDLGERWDAPKHVAALSTVSWKYTRCPTWVLENPSAPAIGHLAVTSYVGVAGVGIDAAERPAGAPGNGALGYDRATKPDEIVDGLENTALFMETGHAVGPWVRGGPSTVRPVDAEAAPLGGTHFTNGWNFRRYETGFNVGLADGSVRFLWHVEPSVLTGLATIAGGDGPTDR